MIRQQILDDIAQTLGSAPDWLSGMPDQQLEHQWALVKWVISDSALTAQQKALVSFGAAEAVHCPY